MASNLEAMASNLPAMASNLEAMASNLLAMASNLIATASNLLAMASNLEAMASNLIATASNLIAMASNRLEAIVEIYLSRAGKAIAVALKLCRELVATFREGEASPTATMPATMSATCLSASHQSKWVEVKGNGFRATSLGRRNGCGSV